MKTENIVLPKKATCEKCGKEIDVEKLSTLDKLLYINRGICIECFYDQCE